MSRILFCIISGLAGVAFGGDLGTVVTFKAERQPKAALPVVPYLEYTEYSVDSSVERGARVQACFGEISEPAEWAGTLAVWPRKGACVTAKVPLEALLVLKSGTYAGEYPIAPENRDRYLAARYYAYTGRGGLPVGEIAWINERSAHQVWFRLTSLCSGIYEGYCRLRAEPGDSFKIEYR